MDSLIKIMLHRGEIEPPNPPQVLVHALSGYEAAALKKVGELTDKGMICEFSVFDNLEETLKYAEKRFISKVISVDNDDYRVYEL